MSAGDPQSVQDLAATVPAERQTEGPPDQLVLPGVAPRRRRPKPAPGLAEHNPVARVAVDVPVEHVSGEYDYHVTQDMDERAEPGALVRVRFSGKLVSGYVTQRRATSDYAGKLGRLVRVLSGEPLVSEEVFATARDLTQLYGGALYDVLRVAVPTRHAAAEKALPVAPAPDAAGLRADVSTLWDAYEQGRELLNGVCDAPVGVAALLELMPGYTGDWPHWAIQAVDLAVTCVHAGRRFLGVLPDARSLDVVEHAWREATNAFPAASLHAGRGAAERYSEYLEVARGQHLVVWGTRSAAYAPLPDVGLVYVHDPAHGGHIEPRSPGAHTVDVAALRGHHAGAAVIYGAFVPPVRLVTAANAGAVALIAPDRAEARRRAPRVLVAGTPTDADPLADRRRMPSELADALRTGAERAPVLVTVPRRGGATAARCASCATQAMCAQCAGPLVPPASGRVLHCRECGGVAERWRCTECDGHRWSTGLPGAERTAADIGRSMPRLKVTIATADDKHIMVPCEPGRLVVGTPGACPWTPGGYATAAVLDAWLQWSRAERDADIEALHAWEQVRTATVGRDAGGAMYVVGKDPQGFIQSMQVGASFAAAQRITEARGQLGIEPVVAAATVAGSMDAVADFLEGVGLSDGWQILGPVPDDRDDGAHGLLRHHSTDPARRHTAQVQVAAELRRLRHRWSLAGRTPPVTRVVGAAWPVAPGDDSTNPPCVQ